ncbi:MAG: MBL fold metallo-hydrolase [Bdellovibrionaceae bacterium]|nr:MBL fold metallo-hydrolase [Pseudobdellovibrionaceae bacterium]
MEIKILGCGTSMGVPVVTCECEVCTSNLPENRRLRASIWIQINGKSYLIDTSTDFRQQALREKINHIDAILYTHPHTDHIGGIDEIRAYNFKQKSKIPIYGHDWTLNDLKIRYSYIFSPQVNHQGGILPSLEPHLITKDQSSIKIDGLPIIPLWLRHGNEDCLGYRIKSVAYATDCNYIPSETLDQMRGLEFLILDCLRIKPHRTHLNLEQALEIIEEIKPKKAILTHLSHDFDYAVWNKKLPKNVVLAYDGIKLTTKE